MHRLIAACVVCLYLGGCVNYRASRVFAKIGGVVAGLGLGLFMVAGAVSSTPEGKGNGQLGAGLVIVPGLVVGLLGLTFMEIHGAPRAAQPAGTRAPSRGAAP